MILDANANEHYSESNKKTFDEAYGLGNSKYKVSHEVQEFIDLRIYMYMSNFIALNSRAVKAIKAGNEFNKKNRSSVNRILHFFKVTNARKKFLAKVNDEMHSSNHSIRRFARMIDSDLNESLLEDIVLARYNEITENLDFEGLSRIWSIKRKMDSERAKAEKSSLNS
jgi:hypothetical protein